MEIYRNKKSGRLYIVLGKALDCTNAVIDAGRSEYQVIYAAQNDDDDYGCRNLNRRDVAEFYQKFEKVEDVR